MTDLKAPRKIAVVFLVSPVAIRKTSRIWNMKNH